MEKEIRRFTVEENIYWTYGIKISKLREELDRLEKKGATEIDIDLSYEYDDPDVSISAYTLRLETDEEFEQRVNKNKEQEEKRKLAEINQLKLLQKKYGNLNPDQDKVQ